jgi:tetratricopeptide (TPR) repeat protein
MSLLLVFAALSPASLAAPALTPLVEECEAKWVASDYDGSIAACEAALKANPNDIEAMWRQARSIYGKGEVLANNGASAEVRIAMYSKVVALGDRVLAIDPNNGLGLHWKGAGMGRTATAKGVLQSLFMADDIENLWLKAIKDDVRYRAATDTSSFPADTYYALGQFYRLCPDSSIVKFLAGTKGDIDQSIQWHRKAAADSPQRIEVLKELGVSLLCKAERDDDAAAAAEGRKWLTTAQGIPPRKKTDELDLSQIPIILKRADEACGYSRDGWQDMDESNLKK